MATAGDGLSTYQSGGAGGKLRKRPIRRSAQATPYDRPPIALRNKSPSLFAKLVDPASRLIYAGADRLFGVFRKRLPSITARRQPGAIEEPEKNVSQEPAANPASKNATVVVKPQVNVGGSTTGIPVATEISDLENMLQQKTFTRSEIERLTTLLQSRTEPNVDEADKSKLASSSHHVSRPDPFTGGTLNKHAEERETSNFDAPISTPVVSSRAFEDEGASPADLAKAYMGTRSTKLSPLALRPSSPALRQDPVLVNKVNNTITFPKTPLTSLAPNTTPSVKTSENSLTTMRSRGRSALYNMPRTPYYRGPSTLSRKGVASPYAWENEGSVGSSRMASKRRSSALDDIGSGGPMRRIRQKANLLSQQSERGSSQKLLLRNEAEPKPSKAVEENGESSKHNRSHGSVPTESSRMASKIFEQLERMSPKGKPSGSKLTGATEKTELPKLLSSSQDNKKSAGQHRVLFSEASESSSRSKDTVEENGLRNMTKSVIGNEPVVTKSGSATKRVFLMSAHEEVLEVDDDNHSNGHGSISLGENKKPGASVLPSNDVSPGAHAGQTALPKVDPISAEFKKGAISSGDSVINEQKTGFKFHGSISSNNNPSSVISQPTSIANTVTPQNKSAVFSTDARPFGRTILINSTTNKDQVQFSVSNTDDNRNTQNAGSSSSANLTTVSSSGNSSIINGTPASSPSIFASSSSFQPSGTTTDKIFSSGSSNALSSSTAAFLPPTATAATMTTTSAASAFSTSAPTSVFASGLANASSTSPFASTSNNGSSIFGLSSSSATLTTNGFQPNTQAASTAVTQAVPFKFGSTSTSASSLFSSSVPSFGLTSAVTSSEIKSGGSTSNPTTSLFGSGFGSTPSFGRGSSVASSETKSGSLITNASAPSFGLGSTIASSETKSGTSTGNIFGSAPFSFGASSTSTSSITSSPFMFGSSNTGASTGSSMFSFSSNSSSPAVFGSSPTKSNDNMSMEDSMADDSNQTATPSASVPAFAQASTSTPGFMFGSSSATPTTPSTVPFQFGGQTNQPQPLQNPFQASGGSPFNAGGSFSLGSGGDDKSSRRIVKVKRQNRKR